MAIAYRDLAQSSRHLGCLMSMNLQMCLSTGILHMIKACQLQSWMHCILDWTCCMMARWSRWVMPDGPLRVWRYHQNLTMSYELKPPGRSDDCKGRHLQANLMKLLQYNFKVLAEAWLVMKLPWLVKYSPRPVLCLTSPTWTLSVPHYNPLLPP